MNDTPTKVCFAIMRNEIMPKQWLVNVVVSEFVSGSLPRMVNFNLVTLFIYLL